MNHADLASGESRNNRLVSLAAAILAVLAALGTLFAHHRSITALSAKNQAILAQARASDTHNAYEAKEIRYNIYRALLASDLVRSAETRKRLESAAEHERASASSVREKAESLAKQAMQDDDRSETVLKSYELLQFAAAAFQISIVLVSISALAGARFLFPFGCALSGVGLVLFVAGFVQKH
ncbi:MAG: DUF4337 family protein [Candidatus Eremiobacteraeota bacterium]|nr:DUF4337 family protein [Candidatus Eremiobacteraeota bacterium]